MHPATILVADDDAGAFELLVEAFGEECDQLAALALGRD